MFEAKALNILISWLQLYDRTTEKELTTYIEKECPEITERSHAPTASIFFPAAATGGAVLTGTTGFSALLEAVESAETFAFFFFFNRANEEMSHN